MHPTVSGGVLPYCFPLLQAVSIGSWPWGGSFPLPTAVKTASPQPEAMGFTGWRAV